MASSDKPSSRLVASTSFVSFVAERQYKLGVGSVINADQQSYDKHLGLVKKDALVLAELFRGLEEGKAAHEFERGLLVGLLFTVIMGIVTFWIINGL